MAMTSPSETVTAVKAQVIAENSFVFEIIITVRSFVGTLTSAVALQCFSLAMDS